MLVLLSLQGAQYIEMASGTETQVSKDSQLYKDYNHLFLNTFSTESIVLMVEGNDVKTEALAKASDRLEQQAMMVPGVTKVSSAASILKQINYAESGRSNVPDSDREVREMMESYPEYFESLVIDETHMLTVIQIEGSSTSQQQKDIINNIEISLKESEFPPGYKLTLTGRPSLVLDIESEMGTSMGMLLGIAGILMVVVLLLVFKHVRWGLLPLPVVLLGVLFTFGVMGYLDVPMTMVSMAAFPILIGLGIDYSIQFHNRMEEEIQRGNTSSQALVSTIKNTAPAVLVALIMTALGFVALFTSVVPMIQDFGKLLLIGVIMCYLSSLFFGLVTLYSFDWISRKNPYGLFKKKGEEKGKAGKNGKNGPGAIENILKKLTGLTLKYSTLILVISFLTCCAGLYADQSIPIQTDTNSMIPQDMPSLINYKNMQSLLSGSGDHLNIILKVDDASNPELLEWMDEFSQHEVENRGHIYSASSIVDLVKERNGGTIPATSGEIQAIYNEIPESQKQEYIEGNQLLHINLDIGTAMADLEITGIEELRDIVLTDVQWMQPPPGVSVTVTGSSVVTIDMVSGLTTGRSQMTLLGVLLVFVGLLIVYRDIVKALSPIIPMLVVIGWSGLVMSALNIAYNPMTAVMGSLILGVGSEYSILMMERYFEERDAGMSPVNAIYQASSTTGTALIASGATTVFGFSALIASPFPMMSSFGLITVIDVLLAMVVTFVIFPPLIVLMDSYRGKKLGIFERLQDLRKKHLTGPINT
ncbi:hydrophobe/amphiphile efflux-3 (HAE3) family transporter [Methanosarcina sp. DH2]|uniref:hydrophobe/amphiphile efflux-3 (HAE3) family transporter n=1 Tax=Methanosarcina sp. DH2 TaxID=2605639 RepID=UPI001E2DC28D|nr:hydrophobe/amphiphile efflux-3 (HAE3) family transporter [Methanosarcina sp. DH2]